MPAQSLRKKPVEKTPPAAEESPQGLVRQLISQVNSQVNHGGQHGDGRRQAERLYGAPTASEVMLDLEIDGMRCLLIRRHELDAHVTLSPREAEIARMVAQGYPNKTIAAVLDISLWTVGTHLRRIFAKLGVGSRAAMVARLYVNGVGEGK
jgi:DNA-binding CsgD family transcriptional regulator